jgi:hypothetical protein
MAEGIVLFIGALCIAALAGVTLGVVHRKWAAWPPVVIGREPRCGQCGYIVRGIATFVCPECGSDLREVGIDTGHGRRPPWGAALVLSIFWTAILVAVAAATATILEDALPRWTVVNHAATLQRPSSAAYGGFSVYASAITEVDALPETGFSPSVLTAELVTLQGQSSVLTGNLQSGTYTYKTVRGATVRPTAPLDTSAILDWMKAAGIDIAEPTVALEAAELLQSLRERPSQLSSNNWSSTRVGRLSPHFQDGNEAWSGTRLKRSWPAALLVLGWVIVWLAGLRWIMRRIASRR